MLSAIVRSFSRNISPLVLRNLASEYSLNSLRRLSEMTEEQNKEKSAGYWVTAAFDSDTECHANKHNQTNSDKKKKKKKKKGKDANKAENKQQTTNSTNANSNTKEDSFQDTAAGAASSSSAKKDLDMKDRANVTVMKGAVPACLFTPDTTEESQLMSSDDNYEDCPEPETGTKKLKVGGPNISTRNSDEIHVDVSSTCTPAPIAESTNDEQFMECEETAPVAEVKGSDTSNSSCENHASMTSPQTAAEGQSTPERNKSKKKKNKKKKNDQTLDNTEVKKETMDVREETVRKSEESYTENTVLASLAAERSPAAATVADMKCAEPTSESPEQMEEETSPDLRSTCGAVEATTATPAPIGNQSTDQMEGTEAEDVKCPSGAGNISSGDPAEAPNLPSSAIETPAVKEGPVMFQLNEVQQSLFTSPASESLAVCIGLDFDIKNGNLRKFCEKFGNIKKHKQGKQVGDVAFLEKDGLFIYYLITKELSSHKINAKTFRQVLSSLKKRCQNDKVTKLTMPRISLIQDGLEWKQVAAILRETFKDTSMTINVYDDRQQTSDHQPLPEGNKKQGQTPEKRGRLDNTADAEAPPGGKKQNRASGSKSSGMDRTPDRGRDNCPSDISKSTAKAAPSDRKPDERSANSTHTTSSDRMQKSAEAFHKNRRDRIPFDPKPKCAGPCLAYEGFRLQVEHGDLFTCSASDSMAIGVSQDFNMGRGIARRFRQMFGRIKGLIDQGRKVGDVAVLPQRGQYLYYLITKEKLSDRPSQEALWSALEAMKNHCRTHRVTNISMPKIGCGSDGLEWGDVAQIVEEVFKDTNIIITVYERIPVQPEGFELLEVQGDLFQCSPSDSMAHCVSQDLHMGKGIAVLFRDSFGGLQKLRAQGKRVGDVAVLPWDGPFIYYLITKENHFDKPTYETLQSSLEAMRKHCQENKVTSIAMPQIGCGLDGLDWYDVRSILCEVFRNTGITITVYYLK